MQITRRAFLRASAFGLVAFPMFGAERAKRHSSEESPSRPDTLFLTWQRDPTTTMTVQWIGPEVGPEDSVIHYAAVPTPGFPLWQSRPAAIRQYPRSDLTLYRAELLGLAPGTDYEFRIGRHRDIYRFRTMPARATNPIHFISGGDCGVNAHTVANNIQAARQDPMFAVIGGDLGYDNGQYTDISLDFLRNYSKHMIGRDGRLIPLLACIGNHEVERGYDQPREKAPFFYALFDGLFHDTGYASLDFGDYLSLILLDTGHTSQIGGDQTDWLEKTLKARIDHPNVFIVNHVPAYPSSRKMADKKGAGEGNRKHWVPLFEKYRVPVVLEHHDHTFKRSKLLLDGREHQNGVLYLGDGSWGRLREPRKPEKLPLLAKVSRDYHLSLHRIQGEERFHLALDEQGRVMDVARSGQRKTGLVRASG